SITTNSATVSWTPVSSATQWEVEYGIGAFTPGTGTMVTPNPTTPSVSLSGLSSGTSYTVFIRDICSVGDTSSPVAYSFTTAISNDSCSGATALILNAPPLIATNIGATTDVQPVICGSTTAGYYNGVWFSFTAPRSEEHTSELQSRENHVCRLLLEK